MVENIVSVYIVCWRRLYRSCRSLVLNRRDSVGCKTVLTPLCVVLLSVCWAWGMEMPHLLASASDEILCWGEVLKLASALDCDLDRSAEDKSDSVGR